MKLKELKIGTKFKYAGHEFTKLADGSSSCYCLLNGRVFESEFGKTNDWAKSPIRKRLNAFGKDGESKSIQGIKKGDLVAVSLNYYACGIPNGRTTDRITLLSWEEVLTYEFPNVDSSMWLRSGTGAGAYGAHGLAPAGGGSDYGVAGWLSVRPALHFREDIEVETEE